MATELITVILLVAGAVSFWAFLCVRTAWLLTHPNPHHVPSDLQPDFDHSNLGLEHAAIKSRSGMELKSWLARPTSYHATVILCHGVWTNHKEMISRCQELLKLGYGVLLFDFSGHGESEGNTTTIGFREVLDLLGIIDYATAMRPELGRLAVWGNSMGGSVAIMAAALDERVEAVIADSPFASLRENISGAFKRITRLPPFLFIGTVVWLGQRLVGSRIDQIRPIDLIATMKPRPLLVIQSGRDSIVHPDSTRALFEAATKNDNKHLWLIAEAGHVQGFHVAREEYMQRISEFLQKSLVEPTEGALRARQRA